MRAQAGTVEWRATWERDQRRAETDRSIVEAKFAPSMETFLHWLARGVDEFGAFWKGADELAKELNWSPTWVYVQLDRACQQGAIEQVQQGGGKHRTSTYALTIGFWRLDPKNPHMHREWSERVKAITAKVADWLANLFISHRDTPRTNSCRGRCWRFAPRWLKQEQLPWEAAP